MAQFNLEDYETVEQRLERFWKDHPQGRVLTRIEHRDERSFIVEADIYFDREDEVPVSSGFAEEIVGQGPVNRTSALENCETSAIGRALANCNYSGAKNRPSREEMAKVARGAEKAPVKPVEVAKPKEVATTPVEVEPASEGLLLTAYAIIENSTTLEQLRNVWTQNSKHLDQQFTVKNELGMIEGVLTTDYKLTTLRIEIEAKKDFLTPKGAK